MLKSGFGSGVRVGLRTGLTTGLTSRLRAGVGVALCGLLAGCGAGGSFTPAATATQSVPGVPAGPMLGFAWSASDNTLKPVLGVVGSSVVGQPITASGAYVAGAGSSMSNAGLVEDSGGNLFALDLPLAAATPVASGLGVKVEIVFSPSGNMAVAYNRGGASVTLVSNLGGQMKAATAATALAMPAGMKITSAVVSDAGTVLVATGASPAGVGVLSVSGKFTTVTSVGQVGGMSFLRGTEDAVLADHGQNTVAVLHNVSGASGVQTLNATGLNGPLAVATSPDAQWAVVANGGDQNVIGIDLKNGGAPVKLACACQPTQLSSLAGGKAFRLNELGSGPVWMFDLSGAAPRMLFVPAVH